MINQVGGIRAYRTYKQAVTNRHKESR